MYEANGGRYKVFQTARTTWQQAEALCTEHRLKLVSMFGDYEVETAASKIVPTFASKGLTPPGVLTYWMGLNAHNTSTGAVPALPYSLFLPPSITYNYTWPDGELVTYWGPRPASLANSTTFTFVDEEAYHEAVVAAGAGDATLCLQAKMVPANLLTTWSLVPCNASSSAVICSGKHPIMHTCFYKQAGVRCCLALHVGCLLRCLSSLHVSSPN